MMRRALALLAFAALLASGAALAHKPSDSYLTLAVDGETVTGQWDIALRDLDFALGLDGNQDGAITWGEVKAKHREIAAYALSRLTLGSADARCTPVLREQLIDNHSDGAYAVLRFAATCPAPPRVLEVGYRLFFDIDPQVEDIARSFFTYLKRCDTNCNIVIGDGSDFTPEIHAMALEAVKGFRTGPLFKSYRILPDSDYLFRFRGYAKGKPAKMAVLACGKDVPGAASDAEIGKLSGAAVQSLKPFRILEIVDVPVVEEKDARKFETKTSALASRLSAMAPRYVHP